MIDFNKAPNGRLHNRLEKRRLATVVEAKEEHEERKGLEIWVGMRLGGEGAL